MGCLLSRASSTSRHLRRGFSRGGRPGVSAALLNAGRNHTDRKLGKSVKFRVINKPTIIEEAPPCHFGCAEKRFLGGRVSWEWKGQLDEVSAVLGRESLSSYGPRMESRASRMPSEEAAEMPSLLSSLLGFLDHDARQAGSAARFADCIGQPIDQHLARASSRHTDPPGTSSEKPRLDKS